MAEVVGSGSVGNDKYFRYTWAGLANGDTGRPVAVSGLADKTVQAEGTFGAGGEVAIQGSMDNVNWETLTDPQGNALVLTDESVEQVLQNPRYVRPSVTAGDGTTDLDVRIGASALK